MPSVPLPTELLLRESREEDIPAITEIYRAAVLNGRATFELLPPDAEEMAARRRAMLAAGYPYVVADIRGEIVGYAYANAYRPRPAYVATVENSVYVREDRHGHGIGSALMRRLIADAEAAGYRQMVAVIGDSANVASVKVHEKLGFTLIGTLRSVGWKHDCWLDTVLMQRALGPGDTTPR